MEPPGLRSGWLRYILSVAQAGLFIYTLSSIAWGTTVQGLAERLEQTIRDRLDRMIRRVLHLGVDESRTDTRTRETPSNDALQRTAPGESERRR